MAGDTRIRPARPEDAEVLAEAEHATAAAQEGLLASRPGEIPVSAFRDKIVALAADGLYVVMESEGAAGWVTSCSTRWGWRRSVTCASSRSSCTRVRRGRGTAGP